MYNKCFSFHLSALDKC